MSENANAAGGGSPANESAAVPQASENLSQINNSPLAENPYVQQLFSILQENGKDTKGLAALIGHVSAMESFVKRAEDKISEMKSQLADMKEIQNHPVKTALTNAIKTLEHKVAEVKERLSELKHNIVEGCKSAIQSFKDKGAAALNNVAKFFHIKGALKAVDKGVGESVAICDRSVANINRFAQEYHETGKHLRNIGRIITGKPLIDTAKEAGKLAKAVSAPYKAEKAAMLGIQKAVNAMVEKLEQLEAAAEPKQARRSEEKKPSILDELDANIQMLAEQDRSRAAPERAKTKGAEL